MINLEYIKFAIPGDLDINIWAILKYPYPPMHKYYHRLQITI